MVEEVVMEVVRRGVVVDDSVKEVSQAVAEVAARHHL